MKARVIKCESQPKYVGLIVDIAGESKSGKYFYADSIEYGSLYFYKDELQIIPEEI